MKHVQPFRSRKVQSLGLAAQDGWRIKRYAIVADNRALNPQGVAAATEAAFARLPKAGPLEDGQGNHGVGFQILHFSEEIPLVSPVFYWQWGSVLFNAHQMRSYTESPYEVVDGVAEVVGCVWEMELVAFESAAWRENVLTSGADIATRVERYLRSTPNP